MHILFLKYYKELYLNIRIEKNERIKVVYKTLINTLPTLINTLPICYL